MKTSVTGAHSKYAAEKPHVTRLSRQSASGNRYYDISSIPDQHTGIRSSYIINQEKSAKGLSRNSSFKGTL